MLVRALLIAVGLALVIGVGWRLRRTAATGSRRYRHLMQSATDAILVVDAEATIVDANRAAAELAGRQPQQLLGMPVGELLPDAASAAERFLVRDDGSRLKVQIAATETDGETFLTLTRVAAPPALGPGKRDDTLVLKRERMQALGRLAGGIAHDFNNLLTVMNGYSNLLLQTFSEDDPEWHDLEQIRTAGERASSLTGQLLAFSRQQLLEPTVLDLNAIVVEADNLLRRVIGEDVELVTLLEESLGPVRADANQIKQVLLHLAVNSRDAMPSGGRLKLETRNVVLGDDFAEKHPGAAPGRYVRLEVGDTGRGMDAETVQHLFEPFVSSRGEEGEGGVGLGLSTVYGIVTQSAGHIEVDTTLGRGTTFRIFLPQCEEAAEVAVAPPPRPRVHGVETILLVEDEASVRRYASRVLRQQGYNVLQAAHGEEALSVFTAHEGERIHLLLADVVMPRMGGKELAQRLRERDRGLRVLFTSGYTGAQLDELETAGVQPRARFLKKPFLPYGIARAVRETLDASA